MHAKSMDEMSKEEQLEVRMNAIENALKSKGIEVEKVVPSIVLGRPSREAPAISMNVSKSQGGYIRLDSEKGDNDIQIDAWEVEVRFEPGSVGLLVSEGWVDLSDDRLAKTQRVWANGLVDIEGKLERGDVIRLRFNNSDWTADSLVTDVRGCRLNFSQKVPHPGPESRVISGYNEYRQSEKLIAGPQELVVESIGLMGRKVVKNWRGGRPGSNQVLNGKATSVERPASDLLRQITIWCSRYSNGSKDGIEMTVELPIRKE